MKKRTFWPRAFVSRLVTITTNHPIVTTAVALVAYLVVFQFHFIFGGDTWAEAYMEYLQEGTAGWMMVIQSSWEGYLTVLPSFLSHLIFVRSLPLQLGWVDIYLRLTTVAFAVGSLSAIGSNLLRPLLPRLWQRVVLAVGLLMVLWHPSSFSFINVWYIGLVPLVLIALSSQKMRVWQQIVYAVFGVLVALTKPTITILPFLVYRAIKTKEYVSNAIIAAACGLQTFLLFFATSNGTRHVTLSIWQAVQAVYVGSGSEVLKLFQLPASDILLLFANLLLVGLLALIIWRRGWVIGLLVAFGYSFAVYAYVLPPEPVQQLAINVQAIVGDHYKLQREILIFAFFVIALGLLLPELWKAARAIKAARPRRLASVGCVALVVVAGVLLYRPIDTDSAAAAINISPFRSRLNLGQPVCMPIAPTPAWSPSTNWYLAYKGGCSFINFDRKADYTKLATPLANNNSITITNPMPDHELMTVLMPIRLSNPRAATTLRLTEETGVNFATKTLPSTRSDVQFVAFEVGALPAQAEYHFTLAADAPVYIGQFTGSEDTIVYPYFMMLPK